MEHYSIWNFSQIYYVVYRGSHNLLQHRLCVVYILEGNIFIYIVL
jgi:hypothetical protein